MIVFVPMLAEAFPSKDSRQVLTMCVQSARLHFSLTTAGMDGGT